MGRLSIPSLISSFLFCASSVSLVAAQQQCYYGPGAENRGPTNLVPCLDGTSACCLLGDTCLSGNACFNWATGNTYQYGCNDITYTDPSCPYKCGWNYTRSPWVALEYCDYGDVSDTYVCHAPESCGCQWEATYGLLHLEQRVCQSMGYDARVALYAPTALAPYVSLPSTLYGKTTYYSGTTISGTSTWITTALEGYTPKSPGPLTTYSPAAPTDIVKLFPNMSPAPSNLPAAVSLNASTTPTPKNGVWSGTASSSTTSSATTTKPSVQTITATQSPSPSSSSSSSSSGGLSTGAKAGIGVGVAVGALAIAGLAGALFFIRRRKAKAAPTTEPDNHTFSEKSPGWQGQGYPDAPPPHSPPQGYYDQYGYHGAPAMVHEADGSEANEEAAARKARFSEPMELDGGMPVQEMASREEVGTEMETPGTSPAPAESRGEVPK